MGEPHGGRERARNADEIDWTTSWKRYLFWQRGESKKAKRRMNKRGRKRIKNELRSPDARE